MTRHRLPAVSLPGLWMTDGWRMWLAVALPLTFNSIKITHVSIQESFADEPTIAHIVHDLQCTTCHALTRLSNGSV